MAATVAQHAGGVELLRSDSWTEPLRDDAECPIDAYLELFPEDDPLAGDPKKREYKTFRRTLWSNLSLIHI